MLFHLLVQCLLLLLHVESWAVSSIIERVIGSSISYNSLNKKKSSVYDLKERAPILYWNIRATCQTLSGVLRIGPSML